MVRLDLGNMQEGLQHSLMDYLLARSCCGLEGIWDSRTKIVKAYSSRKEKRKEHSLLAGGVALYIYPWRNALT
jgi:hypothetical protein